MLEQLVRELALAPHPEGGFFRETYRASAKLPGTQRSVSTAILYLLGAGQRSALHRLDADELWHFHRGDPLELVELTARGAKLTALSDARPQHVVPAGTWFGARPAPGSRFTLVGCTVAPAFEFEHFELGRREQLLAEFPAARAEIEALT
jgi:hypothetical protein